MITQTLLMLANAPVNSDHAALHAFWQGFGKFILWLAVNVAIFTLLVNEDSQAKSTIGVVLIVIWNLLWLMTYAGTLFDSLL